MTTVEMIKNLIDIEVENQIKNLSVDKLIKRIKLCNEDELDLVKSELFPESNDINIDKFTRDQKFDLLDRVSQALPEEDVVSAVVSQFDPEYLVDYFIDKEPYNPIKVEVICNLIEHLTQRLRKSR